MTPEEEEQLQRELMLQCEIFKERDRADEHLMAVIVLLFVLAALVLGLPAAIGIVAVALLVNWIFDLGY